MSDKNFKVKNGIDAVGPITISPLSNATNGLIFNTLAGGRAITFNREGSTVGSIDDWGTYNGSGINIVQPWSTRSPGVEAQSFFWVGNGARSAAGFAGTNSGTNPVIYISQNGSAANDLTQWIKSDNTVLAKVDYLGNITANDLILSGNLTVNGTTTNLNSTNLIIEDKNIIIADVATPTDTTADGAGITIKGATDKTISWVQSTGSFTSSEPFIINTNNSARVAVIVQGVTSQTQDLQQWRNVGGSVIAKVANNGAISSISGGFFGTASGPIDSGNYLAVRPWAANHIPFTVKGFSAQTGDLTRWVDDSGTTLASIGPTGSLTIASTTANNITIFSAKDANNNKVTFSSDSSNRTFLTAQSNPAASTLAGAYFTADGFEESWFNLNTRNNTAGQKYMRFGNLGNKFLVQRLNDAANAITSTPFTIENTSATNSIYVNSTGTIINGSTALGQLTLYPASASTIGMVIRGVASQTANLTEWQDSTGYLISRVDSAGSHWINAAPATSGSVETSSAYLYLTSNRWTGSASSAEVFGLNNFRFGGAGAAGSFALHLKPASSANAYLSIAGDSSRSVGVNVQYPSATSGYGQFGVQIQDASYKGIVVKAAASQTADLQQWMNSEGTVLAKIKPAGDLLVPTVQDTTSAGPYLQFGANDIFIINTGTAKTNLKIRAIASQTANLTEWQNSAGDVLASVNSEGFISIGTIPSIMGQPPIPFSNTFISAQLQTASQIGIAVRGVFGGTGDLQQWQSILGTPLLRVNHFGEIQAPHPGSNGLVVKAAPTLTATITNAIGNGSSVTYTAANTFTVGQIVTVTGVSPAAYNLSSVTITDASATTFTVTNAATGTYVSGGTATVAQSQSLQQWQNSVGTVLASITPLGGITVSSNITQSSSGRTFIGGAADAGAFLNVGIPTASRQGIVVRANASQTANLQEWQTSAGTVLSYIRPSGGIYSTAADDNRLYNLGIGGSSSGISWLYVTPQNAAEKPVVVRGHASQTGNLTEWQNSAGTVLTRIASDGAIYRGALTVDSFGALYTTETITIGGNASQRFASGGMTIINRELASSVIFGIKALASQTGDLTQWRNSSDTVLAKVDANGNFSAISKSFDIPHPTKENMRLRYASLEGNEHGVYVRGTTKEKIIELPEYWTELVDESTITVSLTSIGKFQKVYVEKIEGNKIYIGGRVKEISYAVFGERKDIDKLIVEY
jgi:hypothetical protein